MEIAELNGDERLALAALMKAVVMADGAASAEEHVWLADVVSRFGADAYRAALDQTDRRFPDETSLKKFLATTGRPDARDLIYGTLLGAATVDSTDRNEVALLDWLADAWHIEVVFEGLPEDEDEDGDGDE